MITKPKNTNINQIKPSWTILFLERMNDYAGTNTRYPDFSGMSGTIESRKEYLAGSAS